MPPQFPNRNGPRPHSSVIKAQGKAQVEEAFDVLKGMLMGEEEPEDFLQRKLAEKPMSPKLAADIARIMSPPEAPARTAEATVTVEDEGQAPAPRSEETRRGTAQLTEGCAGCRVAMALGGPVKRCSEHQ